MTPLPERLQDVIAEMRVEASLQKKAVWIPHQTFMAWIERLEAATALQPSAGGEPVAWRWHHPDGDSGSWQDRDPERERSWRDDEGCTIEYAYLASPAQPSGFVLVPLEPTEAMRDAALDCQDADPADDSRSQFYYAYKAALTAAPSAPRGQGVDRG